MASTSPSVAVDEIYQAEFTRVLGGIVDVRLSKVPWALAVYALLACLEPTPARIALAAFAASALLTLSIRERERFQREGFSPAFLARNAAAMASLHTAIFALTGGLASPFLPVMLIFTFGVSAVLGESQALRWVLAVQVGCVGLLTWLQLAGWEGALAPDWLLSAFTAAHTIVLGLALLLLLRLSSRFGRGTRRLFDQVVSRTAAARQDLLVSHQAQAEELTALSGAIAHELKNPLASVKGLAGLLAKDLAEGKPAERMGVLRREVDRMQGILDEFLNFSRPAVPVAAAVTDLFSLGADVAALHEGVARDRGLRLEVLGEGRACIDARKTRQALINLVQNALDAAPPGSVVGLRVGGTPDAATVEVDDDGPGLDAAVSERIFQAGVTTKAQGSGIGLTIARGLARQQGGDVTLRDRDPRGCRATLTLPRGLPG